MNDYSERLRNKSFVLSESSEHHNPNNMIGISPPLTVVMKGNPFVLHCYHPKLYNNGSSKIR